MDRFGEWRPIEPAAEDGDDPKPAEGKVTAKPVEPARPEANVMNVRLIGLLGAAVVAVVAAVVWMSSAAPAKLDVSGGSEFDPAATAESVSIPTTAPAGILVVDIEGAVARPGLQQLATGSRVGDAIAAAGGYAPTVDIDAAAAQLNLASPLADGDKVHVPARGEVVAAAESSFIARDPSVVGPSGVGGLINVNTATSDELDTLPGIGPVTAAKIIAAREEAPFATVDELVSREVVGSATFEKLKALVTVAP